MEIYPRAADLKERWENNLCLSIDLEIRGMTLGQGLDTP